MVNFSVIIPTFNRPHLVGRAIDSALANLVDGDEILVIDDGSDSDYSKIIETYNSSIVKYKKIINKGVSGARNYGLKVAKNNYIAFLDDDDEWYKHHLDFHRKVYLSKPDLAGVFCNFDNTSKNGKKQPNGIARWSEGNLAIQELLQVEEVPNIPEDTLIYIGYHYKNQLTTDYILPSSFSYNRKICGDNEFLLGLNRNETWLFNSHICSYGSIAYIDNITCVQHGDADIRYTDITWFETIMSRLLVMSKEWGSNNSFLKNNNKLYDEIRFQDFFQAFKISLSSLSVNKIFRLVKLVGPHVFLRYATRSFLCFFKHEKVKIRVT